MQPAVGRFLPHAGDAPPAGPSPVRPACGHANRRSYGHGTARRAIEQHGTPGQSATSTHRGTPRRRTGGFGPEGWPPFVPDRGVLRMKDDIVIVSAARTPVGAFNGAFANLPAHELGKVAIEAALKRAGRRRWPGVRSHHGPDPDRRSGPEPGPSGLDRRRHPGRKPGLGRQPALRLRPARGRARLPGDPQRRFRDRGRRRPGIDEHGAALRSICATA